MNRDESRMRGFELPPEIVEKTDYPTMMAPFDSNSQGTWIGVNEAGIVIALLNGYREYRISEGVIETNQGTYYSRGGIIPLLLKRRRIEEVIEFLNFEFDPHRYRSFDLYLAQLGNGSGSLAWHYEWLGNSEEAHEGMLVKQRVDPWAFATSSSFRTKSVCLKRAVMFDEWERDGADFEANLPAIHLMQHDKMGAYGIMMDRPDANTRSVTQIEVNSNGSGATTSRLRYWPSEQVEAYREEKDRATIEEPAAELELNSGGAVMG